VLINGCRDARTPATSDFADLCLPFDPLLFFAATGNGDQLAFVLRDRR